MTYFVEKRNINRWFKNGIHSLLRPADAKWSADIIWALIVSSVQMLVLIAKVWEIFHVLFSSVLSLLLDITSFECYRHSCVVSCKSNTKFANCLPRVVSTAVEWAHILANAIRGDRSRVTLVVWVHCVVQSCVLLWRYFFLCQLSHAIVFPQRLCI